MSAAERFADAMREAESRAWHDGYKAGYRAAQELKAIDTSGCTHEWASSRSGLTICLKCGRVQE